jgi:hypothetical protein
MKKIIKAFVPPFIMQMLRQRQQRKQFKIWQETGCPVPPPHIAKQNTIKEYQQKYGCRTLVETGTYLGDMVYAQKNNFEKIISVELSVPLFEKVKKRFRNDPNVILMQGDSGKVMPDVMEKIEQPAIFWLDGHYSSGITAMGDKACPIYEEIAAIFNSKPFNHVLLIDDARLFTGSGDYPTIEELTHFVKTRNGKYQAIVKDDIIRYAI